MEYENLLIRCIAQRLEPSNGRSVAACFIYKCLRQWNSFEAEKTSIFDRIIQTIDHDIEKNNNKDVLAYWLSNASTLLVLSKRMFEASETTVGERIEAKNPAVLFKNQLTTYVEKIYGMIRENSKEELVPLVNSCIQAARGVSNNIPIGHFWQQIVENILDFLKILDSNNVPPFLVRKIFMQIFSFINVRIFNSLLLRRECCSFKHGEYLKKGLSELESWCHQATEKYAGSAWDELNHTRQATEFLINKRKTDMTLDYISHDLCPALNIKHLYKISSMYLDIIYNTPTVSPDVISKMKVLALNIDDSESFLLEENLSIPFSVDDLSKSMDQISIADIEPPPLIRDHSGFSFLSQSL